MQSLGFYTLVGLSFLSQGCGAIAKKTTSRDVVKTAEVFDRMQDPNNAPGSVARAAKSIVRITIPSGTLGTGTFISADGLFLTNNHVLGTQNCLRQGCFVTIDFNLQRSVPYDRSANKKSLFARPLAVSAGSDVTIFETFVVKSDWSHSDRFSSSNFLNISSKTAKELVGSKIHVVGHPHGQLKKWTSGEVYSFQNSWMFADVFILPGNSGSPGLDSDGNIVGILHRGNGDSSSVNQKGDMVTHAILTSSDVIVNLSAVARENQKKLQENPKADILGEFMAPSSRDMESDTSTLKLAEALYNSRQLGAAELSTPEKKFSVTDKLIESCSKKIGLNSEFRLDGSEDLEEINELVQECTAVVDWLRCDKSDSFIGFYAEESCSFNPEKKQTLAKIFQRIVDIYLQFNGQPNWFWGVNACEWLGESKEELKIRAQNFSNDPRIPLNMLMAQRLLQKDISDIPGFDAVGFALNYKNSLAVEQYIRPIFYAQSLLVVRENLEVRQFFQNMLDLLKSENISLEDRLFLETQLHFMN